MPLPSGFDVKIGAYEFTVDSSVDGHYIESFETLGPNYPSVIGDPEQPNLIPAVMKWTFTDWSGGEGNQFYDENAPNKYDIAVADTRMPGFITSRPTRTDNSLTVTNPSVGWDRACFAVANDRLFVAGGQSLYYTTDGSTWTAVAGPPTGPPGDTLGANWQFRSLAGDPVYLYAIAHDDPANSIYGTDGVGIAKIWRLDKNNNWTLFATSTIGAFHDSILAMIQGRLYRWTGLKLREYDTAATIPIGPGLNPGGDEVYYTGGESALKYPSIWDAIPADSSIVFMAAGEGETHVYEFKEGTGRPLWSPGYPGFTGKKLAYSNSVLFCVGQFQNRMAVYAMSMVSKQSLFLGYLRPWYNQSLENASAGPGPTVMMCDDAGNVYIYDEENNAFSYLDGLASDGTTPSISGPSIVYRGKRYSGYRYDSTTLKVVGWDHDESARSTDTSWEVVMPAWDYNLPEYQKLLISCDITCKGLVAGEQVTIEYCLEEDDMYPAFGSLYGGTWNTVGTFSTTDGTSKIYEIASPSNPVKFRWVRFRLRGQGAMRIRSFNVKAYVADYQRFWDLALRVKDERQPNAKGNSRAVDSETLRSYLLTLISNRNPVTFLNGFRYKEGHGRAPNYSSHTVMIEAPRDVIEWNGEGTIYLRLRDIDQAGDG